MDNKAFLNKLKKDIVSYFVMPSMWDDMINPNDREKAHKVLKTLVEAYNEWQEGEHSGVDYLFNLNDPEDLKCCIDGGLVSDDIMILTDNYNNAEGMTNYFFFGENYITPKQLTTKELIELLSTHIDEAIIYTLTYGCKSGSDAFKYIYDNYMAKIFEATNDND